MHMFLKAACCAMVSFLSIHVSAQTTNLPRYQFGISGGVFIYQGDLTPERLGPYRTPGLALNFFASRILSSSFSVRANVALGKLQGDDSKYAQPEYRQQRNFLFRTPVAELSVMGEWNIPGRNDITKGFAPYLLAGAGISILRVMRDYSQLNAAYFGAESPLMTGLEEDLQRNPPRVLPVIPVGAGVRYYLNDKLGISAETTYRLFANDYIDGFSRAANPSRGDHYYSHTIGLVYRLGKKNMLACPVVKY